MPENHWALMVLTTTDDQEWSVRFDRIESFRDVATKIYPDRKGCVITTFSGERMRVKQSVETVQDMMIECAQKVNANA